MKRGLFDRRDYIILAIVFVCWLVAMALWPRVANAQVACGPSISVLLALDRLGETEHETMTRPAKNGDGDILWIMWLNPETGSWTLTGTHGPVTCLYAGGHSGFAGQTIADYVIGPAL